jgi:hypothetical protein
MHPFVTRFTWFSRSSQFGRLMHIGTHRPTILFTYVDVSLRYLAQAKSFEKLTVFPAQVVDAFCDGRNELYTFSRSAVVPVHEIDETTHVRPSVGPNSLQNHSTENPSIQRASLWNLEAIAAKGWNTSGIWSRYGRFAKPTKIDATTILLYLL